METEARLERYRQAERWPSIESLSAMLDSQMAAYHAVRQVLPDLARTADRARELLADGDGRMVYAGAGASARLATQDGVELTPTFGWPKSRLLYLIAGGGEALTQSIEGAEDDFDAGRAAADRFNIGCDDIVIGVAASGRTPFTLGVVGRSRDRGALTIGMSCNAPSPLLEAADYPLAMVTGPEFLAGSTRMIAGTAQKIALNLLSTQIMIGLGKIHDGLMVDVIATNQKLRLRQQRMVESLCDCSAEQAAAYLDQAGGHVKLAVLLADGVPISAARARLEQSKGRLREARNMAAGSG